VIFIPEWPKGEFVSILASFYVWTKSLVRNNAPHGFYNSEMLQSQKIFSSFSVVWMIEPSRPDDVPYRLDSRQTKHHPSGRHVSPSGPSTVSRKVLSSLHTFGRFSSTSGRLSVLDQFQKGKIDQSSGRCGISS
jgi:hypothetical protein